MEDIEEKLTNENQAQKVEQNETVKYEQKIEQDKLIEEKQKICQDDSIEEKQKIEQIEAIEENKKEDSQEVSIETPSESIEIKTEDANTTNCLALTIQEDHKLVAFKNVFLRSIRMSWKVVVSAITLALLKLFS